MITSSPALTRPLMLALTSCAIACGPSGAPAPRGDGGTRVSTAEAGAPLAAPCPEPAVACEGWAQTASPDGCLYQWTSCTDEVNREIRCTRDGDQFACLCIAGARQPLSFQSADICTREVGPPSVDRAMLSEIARTTCGFPLSE